MGWILTIGGGIVVGTIVLIIEYSYFQKNKKKENQSGELSAIGVTDISQSWTMAIDSALQSFGRNYPKRKLTIIEMKLKRRLVRNKALIAIRVDGEGSTNFFYLEVDKSGDILRISDHRHEVFGWG